MIAPANAASDVDARIVSLRRNAPSTTAYTEIRFVDLLAKPLVLRGTLALETGGALIKHVESPNRETTTIADGKVVIERTGKPKRMFSLQRAPELAGFLESFGALLAGDAERLSRTYDVTAIGNDHAWRLVLTPRSAKLARHLRSVEIEGRGTSPHCFFVEETAGDASVLLVDALAAAPLPETPTRAALNTLCRNVR